MSYSGKENPLALEPKEPEVIKVRSFVGELMPMNKVMDTPEAEARRKEFNKANKKALKYYLKGRSRFILGYDLRFPRWSGLIEKWTEIIKTK